MKKIKKYVGMLFLMCFVFMCSCLSVGAARGDQFLSSSDRKVLRISGPTNKYAITEVGSVFKFDAKYKDVGIWGEGNSGVRLNLKGKNGSTYVGFKPYDAGLYFCECKKEGYGSDYILLYAYKTTDFYVDPYYSEIDDFGTLLYVGRKNIYLQDNAHSYIDVTYKNSNPNAVSINGKKITAKKPGNVVVTATFKFHGITIKTRTCKFRVVDRKATLKSMYFSPNTVKSLYLNDLDEEPFYLDFPVIGNYSDGSKRTIYPKLSYVGGMPKKAGTFTVLAKQGKLTCKVNFKVLPRYKVTKILIDDAYIGGYGKKVVLGNIDAVYCLSSGGYLKYDELSDMDKKCCSCTYKYGKEKSGRKYCDVTVTYTLGKYKVSGKKRFYNSKW